MSMTPYYQDEAVCIYHGDCREVLPHLFRVDAVIADPPFGIGFKYESHDDTPEGYGQFVWSVIEAAESLCAPASPVFVWQAMPNVRRFAEWFPRNYRVFAAAKNFVQMRPTPMQYAYDPVLVWWTEGEKPWTAGTSSRDFHVGNTAGIISRKTHEKSHPCPRPLDQVEHIVAQWVKPGGTILDPFMGSGTTLVAAKRLGRKAIGIERERKYCDLAVERLSQGALGLELGSSASSVEVA
jgi:site-specific DNA-methyltransferase (adenine-specific)